MSFGKVVNTKSQYDRYKDHLGGQLTNDSQVPRWRSLLNKRPNCLKPEGCPSS